jgi:hypothetical protein
MVVQMEFATGGVAVLTFAVFPRPEARVELELLGDGWLLSFGENFSPLRLAENDRSTSLRSMNQPAADHADAFLQAVALGKPEAIASRYTEALRTLAVCHAASMSAQEGRVVTLAELE